MEVTEQTELCQTVQSKSRLQSAVTILGFIRLEKSWAKKTAYIWSFLRLH